MNLVGRIAFHAMEHQELFWDLLGIKQLFKLGMTRYRAKID